MSNTKWSWNRGTFHEIYSGHYNDWLKTREDQDDEVDHTKTDVTVTCTFFVELYNKEGRKLYSSTRFLDEDYEDLLDEMTETYKRQIIDEYYKEEYPKLKME